MPASTGRGPTSRRSCTRIRSGPPSSPWLGKPPRPWSAQGSLVYPMPVLDSPNSINNRAMADRLAATLGPRPAAMMKSHGAVTVGRDIVEAFVLANYLEENAYRQYMALQIGKPYAFSEQEVALCREKRSEEHTSELQARLHVACR